MKKFSLILLIVFILFPIAAQEEEAPPREGIETIPEQELENIIPVYSLGDQFIGMNLGVNFPLFFDFFYLSGDDRFVSAGQFYPVPLAVGMSLEYNSFLNDRMSLGFTLAVMVGGTYNNTHLVFPITAKYQYILRFHPFYLPLSIEAGICINKVSDSIYFGGIIKPGVGLYYRFSTIWDFGFNLKYWWVPELYFGDDPPKEQSAFGNFLEVTLSAIYHF